MAYIKIVAIWAIGFSASAALSYSGGYADVVAAYRGASPSYLNELQVNDTHGYFKQYKSGNESVSLLEISGSYLRLIKPQIQVGGGVLLHSATGNSYNEFWGQGIYNMDSNLAHAFYGVAAVGMFNTVNNRGLNESKFGFYLGAGKRFPLWGNVNYAPELRLANRGDGNLNLDIYFIKLSVFWN